MTLSDKRNNVDDNWNVTYLEKDVKEAIKELKDKLVWTEEENVSDRWVRNVIDKIFGKELCE